jgi:membrane fusion protein, multidrug efflux system
MERPMSSAVLSLRLVVAVLFCVWSLWLVGCKQESASAPAQPIPEVQVVTVTPQTIPDQPEFIGQTDSSRPVEIRSQVTGILKERFFSEGRDVKKGEHLYQIDPLPFQAAYLSAKAKVAQSKARLVQAQQNLKRVQPLLAEQAVSQKDVDDAIAEDLSARAALEGANADVVKAKFDFDNTLIVAPIAGRIERSKVFEGRLIAAQTDLLTTIHQLDPMYVYASAPETFVLKRFRDRAEKRVQGATLYELRGVITFSDGSTYPHEGMLDMLEVGVRTQTGTRDFRVTFPNPEKALAPGQFVKLRIIGAVRTDAILIPQKAVQQGPKGSVVFVVGEGDKVELRDIQATAWQGNQWVVQEGLRAGDRVIVEGLQRIGPGMAVKPVPATGPEVSPAPPSAPPDKGSTL